MENYSQSTEQGVILSFFESIGIMHGNFLDLGANDGITLSNTWALRQLGWGGIYVEPSVKAYQSLLQNNKNRDANDFRYWCFNVAIADYEGQATFYESGEHLGKGDTALLSTLNPAELKRWEGSNNSFKETKCHVWDFKMLQQQVTLTGRSNKYDFVSMDVEGLELIILPQMDFNELGTRMACIEFNGKDKEKYDAIMLPFGFRIIHQNAENLIYAR